MRQIKEVLRLRYELNLSQQKISDATGIARSTVKDYLLRASAADLTWPLDETITNERLNELLFPPQAKSTDSKRVEPDWKHLHHELKKKGVTIQLLWEEYKRANPSGYQYSWFAERYRQWAKTKLLWMPQHHKAGEKTFVDYSGLTVPIWSSNLKEVLYQAEIFVGVTGATDYLYCCASKTQQLSDWIDSHIKMFEHFGGVTELIVPDNLRSGVTKTHRYEPDCNRTYEEMARHYGCAVLPARSARPKDKAKVEKAVQTVQRWILAKLRNQQFTNLDQLNITIANLLEEANDKPFQRLDETRHSFFNKVEKETLRPLPVKRYEFANWQRQKVNGGYHVTVNRHHYSVPHQYAHKKVDIRSTNKVIEIFYQENKIASHQRDDEPLVYTTLDAHRPESHREQAFWDSQRLTHKATQIGHHSHQLINRVLTNPKRHLHQKERSALGILRLADTYGEDRFEKACCKALEMGTTRYDSIQSILKRKLEKQEDKNDETENQYNTPAHDNVRGNEYYH